MANFTDFLNILPDPNNSIGAGGQSLSSASGGQEGAGFASVKLSSEHQISNTRTNSGKLISRESGAQKWKISITYNPMTREEFEPIYSFLLQKRGQLSPFFVSLPQYKNPQKADFLTFLESTTPNKVFSNNSEVYAGQTQMTIDNDDYTSTNARRLTAGDLFTVGDSNNLTHTKVYQITRVEIDGNSLTPGTVNDTTDQRISFIPALQHNIPDNTVINLQNPLFKVVMKSNIQEYQLNSENLYTFSLELEEAQ